MKELEGWNWPDPDDPGHYVGLKERAEALRRETDCAIVINPSNLCASQAQRQRGFANWMKDLYRYREYSCRQMDIIADIWIGIVHRALDECGKNVDVAIICEDLGTQSGPQCPLVAEAVEELLLN